VRRLRRRAVELEIDATRIVALAALLGLTGDRSNGSASTSAVAGVVDWHGAAALTTPAAQALPTAIARSDPRQMRSCPRAGRR
jgi:hypothetical protein